MTIITKIYYDNIEIDDPISFYTSDVSLSLLNIVKQKYQGRCYMSSYIKNINRIIRMSRCVVNQRGVNNNISNPVSGIISVEFEAECIIYVKGEIIPCCNVVQTDKYNYLYCSTEYAGIYVQPDAKNASISKDQLISVIVESTVYDVLQEKMSVNAVLFIPTVSCISYELLPPTNTLETAQQSLTRLIASYKDQIPTDQDQTTSAWKSFASLIYPHKVKHDNPKNIENILTAINTYISPIGNATSLPKYIIRDSKYDLSTPSIIYSDIPADDSTIIQLPIELVFVALLENYCNYTNLVKKMVSSYHNADLINKHKNVWTLYGLNRV